tara:strand:+ start:160 stop:267 length:108 start_codon:yes stop_codon:yes gene_type:complete
MEVASICGASTVCETIVSDVSFTPKKVLGKNLSKV